MPPACRNHRTPRTGETPTLRAASSPDAPAAIAAQNCRRCSRRATGGRPGERKVARPALSDLRFRVLITGPSAGVLRRPVESGQYTSHEYRALLRRHGLVCSMSRRGNCRDDASMESFFGSLKSELVHGRRFETHGELRSALFDYIEGFYNTRRRHTPLGFLTPVEHEARHHEQRA